MYTASMHALPWVRAPLHKALGHAACGTRANSWTLGLRPQRRPPRRPLLSSPRWLRLSESRSGGRGAVRSGRRAEVVSCLRGRRGGLPAALPQVLVPGPCRSAGATGSMKGGDRAYSRGPSSGWLFAKCCCCFPCRGE